MSKLALEIGEVVDREVSKVGRVKWKNEHRVSYEILMKIINGNGAVKLGMVVRVLDILGYELKISKRGAECVEKSE